MITFLFPAMAAKETRTYLQLLLMLESTCAISPPKHPDLGTKDLLCRPWLASITKRGGTGTSTQVGGTNAQLFKRSNQGSIDED
jgi:hypothetical protein